MATIPFSGAAAAAKQLAPFDHLGTERTEIPSLMIEICGDPTQGFDNRRRSSACQKVCPIGSSGEMDGSASWFIGLTLAMELPPNKKNKVQVPQLQPPHWWRGLAGGLPKAHPCGGLQNSSLPWAASRAHPGRGSLVRLRHHSLKLRWARIQECNSTKWSALVWLPALATGRSATGCWFVWSRSRRGSLAAWL